ncbi:unnamed protein product [Enterobius vermicularis]|uniref:Glyco_transf_7N domain-containing protein n=1 Tax=Enterobius vermicularis TaxID=51028 RepID=A0A0N4UT73_ENTVE|nr:unnamed protein product [Enterobius vermicularis]
MIRTNLHHLMNEEKNLRITSLISRKLVSFCIVIIKVLVLLVALSSLIFLALETIEPFNLRSEDFLEISSRRVRRYKEYCVIENVLVPKVPNSKDSYIRITLVLHLSSNYLDRRLVEQVGAWDGPISLTIVLPETETRSAMWSAEKQAF